MFDAIYRANTWGDPESASGLGSTRARATAFLADLLAVVSSLGVSSLLDAPCGDFNWAAPLSDSVDSYIGVDIVPSLIKTNQRRHSAPHRRFLCKDIIRDPLPRADLVLCRDALVHLTLADALSTIESFRRSGAEYLLATTFVGDRQNQDVATGEWRPLNLERPPFFFPAPLALVDERCHHSDGVYADKRLGLWRLRDLGRLVEA